MTVAKGLHYYNNIGGRGSGGRENGEGKGRWILNPYTYKTIPRRITVKKIPKKKPGEKIVIYRSNIPL